MALVDPFKTEKPLTSGEKDTFNTIDLRLQRLSPGIEIKGSIGRRIEPGKTEFSSLQAHESTLDGINFRTDHPEKLTKSFHNAKDVRGRRAFASMKEDPDHWALKASFGKTVGTGWREIWRPAPRSLALEKPASEINSVMKMRFGTVGLPFIFSALHCSVDDKSGMCNIHIDETGFVMQLPTGTVLTPDAYQHTVNELLLKTEFRDWLNGLTSNQRARAIITEVIGRVSVVFPNAFNGYAGLDKTINSFRRPTSFGGAVKGTLSGAWNILKPVGISIDLLDTKSVKLQVNATRVESNSAITITMGGRF